MNTTTELIPLHPNRLASTKALTRIDMPQKFKQDKASADYWQAVLRRDRRADGTFVFAVSSTPIYCRPSCPARRPLRTNTAFYATPEAAERSGYRPCRRCKPQEQ